MEGKINEHGGQTEAYQEHPVWRMDKRLADLLHGEHDISTLDREGKVVALANLVELYDVTGRVGWHVHTGDWDWQVEVTLADGTVYSTAEECFHLNWPGEKGGSQEDVTACVDAENTFTATVYNDGPELKGGEIELETHLVRVDNVAKVRFEELG